MHYQTCPKCQGQGTVSKPPYVPGDVYQWSATATSFPCDVCHGAKVLLVPDEQPRIGDVLEYAKANGQNPATGIRAVATTRCGITRAAVVQYMQILEKTAASIRSCS